MNSPLKYIVRFGLALVVFTAALYILGISIQSAVGMSILSPMFSPIMVFLFGITFIAYCISIVGILKNSEMGVYSILGGLIFKMLFSLSFFIFILYRFSTENTTLLGLNFFCVYLLLSVFEVIVLLRNLRRNSTR